jgi:anti-sigma factor RsiW
LDRYTHGEVVATRLRELREEAARERRARRGTSGRARLRFRLGGVLIAAGRQLAGPDHKFKPELSV